ncbi:MAG: hypothetical protein KBG38_07165 [Candidatus Cloacimonas sp.]|nr:hypothetical protein [Candidatus Cloacimonas sp.]HQG82352.1 hypothetical protein [Caldisericia bacterium]
MPTYRLKWESESPYKTDLQSDTIFGHFAWAISYLKGAVFLKEVIKELIDKHSLVFSSAFPENRLPLPVFPKPISLKQRLSDWESNRKKYKEMIWMPKGKFIDNGNCFSWLSFYQSAQISYSDMNPKKVLIIHNTIDRLTGTTTQGGGNLYASETIFPPDNYIMESYLDLNSDLIDIDIIRQICSYISSYGFGKDKSTGYGRFNLTVEEYAFPTVDEYSGFMNLSNMVPAKNDPVQAYYNCFPKFGKLGGSFALWESPFKYPLFIIKPGAIFMKDRPIGSLLADIHPKSKTEGIVQNLYSFSIPIKISEEQ